MADPLGDNTSDWVYWIAPGISKISKFSLFESEFINIHHRFMEIPIAGYLGKKGLSLQLFVEGKDKLIEIIPPKLAKETWVSAYIRTPTRPFKVVAVDYNPDSWFAFAMPRGVGILSFANLWLLDKGPILFFIGIGGILLFVGLAFVRQISIFYSCVKNHLN